MLGSWCLVMLAATVPAFAQTLTSTSTLTAIVTVSKCNPTNTGKYMEMRVKGGGMLCLKFSHSIGFQLTSPSYRRPQLYDQ